jgi:hypothetical protein
MSYILTLPSKINIFKLQANLRNLLSQHNLHNNDQVTLTSIDGKDDWTGGNGKTNQLLFPEADYNILNESLTNTYIGSIIYKYSNFYRWRLLKIKSKQTYSIHADAYSGQVNKRIHVPIITNPDAFFVFYDQQPSDNSTITIQSHNLKVGKVYEVNTTGYHTAVNYGLTDRYHLVGVRYE